MFESARAKIARAREHLDFLEADFRRFVASQPYTIVQEVDPEAGEVRLVYEPHPIPPDWSPVLGELLFNARCALDYVVYELSNGADDSEFPIYSKASLWQQGERKIAAITHDRARQFIEYMQPYHAGEHGSTFDGTALWILRELNNIDKHRTLHVCRRQLGEFTVEVEDLSQSINLSEAQFRLHLGDLDKRAVIGRLWGRNRQVKVKLRAKIRVTFDEGPKLPAITGQSIETISEFVFGQVVKIVDQLESIVSV
jgi:hypothetical protein